MYYEIHVMGYRYDYTILYYISVPSRKWHLTQATNENNNKELTSKCVYIYIHTNIYTHIYIHTYIHTKKEMNITTYVYNII